LNRARASGKDARTKFRRLAYYPPPSARERGENKSANLTVASPESGEEIIAENTCQVGSAAGPATPPPPSGDEGYSIVHCLPLTGRTHQIRVHLQFLGHPITNDPIYSNRRVFGASLGRADVTGDNDKQIIARLSRMGKTELADSISYQTFQAPPPSELTNGGDPAIIDDLLAREHDEMVNDYLKRKGEKMNGLKCDVCGTDLYTDPGAHELGIFLHAVSYADVSGKWKYKSKMPGWALPPSGMEGPTSVADWWEEEGEEMVVGSGMAGQTALVEGVGAVDIGQMWNAEKDGSSERVDPGA